MRTSGAHLIHARTRSPLKRDRMVYRALHADDRGTLMWVRRVLLTGVWVAGSGCSGEEPCLAVGDARIEVTVTSQETGEPVEGALVELDGEPCADEGGGLYTCIASTSGTHSVLVLGGIEYAGYAEMVEVPELGCDEVVIELDISVLPAMAR
jgi:hypothetical protein